MTTKELIEIAKLNRNKSDTPEQEKFWQDVIAWLYLEIMPYEKRNKISKL